MEGEWVDFRVIKEAVTIDMVLDRYGIVLKKSGHELRGKCPIHLGTNNKHFTANVSKNVFKCFFAQCGAHGNVLDLVAAMDRCSVREAAVKLRDWFRVGDTTNSSNPKGEFSVKHGIYQDKDSKLYEVIGTAKDMEDQEVRIVYRELFGDYRLCIGPPRLLESTDASVQPLLNPVKFL
jgi:DNA primase